MWKLFCPQRDHLMLPWLVFVSGMRQTFLHPLIYNPEWPFLRCIILFQVNEAMFKIFMIFNHSPSVMTLLKIWREAVPA